MKHDMKKMQLKLTPFLSEVKLVWIVVDISASCRVDQE